MIKGDPERKREKKKREKRRDFRVRSSYFSLDFQAIGPAISGGARGRVHPHDKGFAKRPKLGSFDKLREVGLLLLWLFFTLRVVWWLSALRGNVWWYFEP